MAKLSSTNKNERRKKLVKKYAGRYAKLKAIAADTSLDDGERLIARLKMAEIPRNGNPTRIRNRCELTGRPRAYYRKFRLCRVQLRDLATRTPDRATFPAWTPALRDSIIKETRGFFSAFLALKGWHGMTVPPLLTKSPPPGLLKK